MERFKTLDYRQKWIFLIMGVMVLVFSILYPVTLSRVGYSYRDAILVPREAEALPYIPEKSRERLPALP